MGAKHLVTAFFVAAVVVACSSPDGFTLPELAPSVSQADADALAEIMFGDLEASGVSDISTKTVGPGPAVPVDTGVSPQAPCSPQKLTPPRACAFGGNIYTTINQTCPDKNLATCCGTVPASCTEFKGNLSGQYKTLYNACKTGLDAEANGTINGTMTGEITGSCAGIVGVKLKIVQNGSFTVRVNGVDACPGGISLTTQIVVYDRATVVMAGTICGRSVLRTSKSACYVQCGDKCCPKDSYCSKCGACLPTTYPVDCCASGCPSGTTCNGAQCKL